MQGELTSEEIDSLLQTENYGRLACSADGRPYIVPVGFAYDGKRFICYGAKGLKIEMMRKNSEVCFQVDHIENLVNWKSVVAWGKFVELSGTEASTSARLIIDKLFSALDYPTMPLDGMRSITPPSRSPDFTKAVVYQIEIEQKTGRYERIPMPSERELPSFTSGRSL